MFYELGYIIPATLENDNFETIRSKIADIIKEEGGVVIIEPPSEKRKLAYQIKRTRQGIFQFIRFSAPENNIREITRGIKIIPEILRSQIIHLKATSAAEVTKSAAMPKLIPNVPGIPVVAAAETKSAAPDPTAPFATSDTDTHSTQSAPSESKEPISDGSSTRESKEKNEKAISQDKPSKTKTDKKTQVSLDDLDKKIDEILEGKLTDL